MDNNLDLNSVKEIMEEIGGECVIHSHLSA